MKRTSWDRDQSLGVATVLVAILMALTAINAPRIKSTLAQTFGSGEEPLVALTRDPSGELVPLPDLEFGGSSRRTVRPASDPIGNAESYGPDGPALVQPALLPGRTKRNSLASHGNRGPSAGGSQIYTGGRSGLTSSASDPNATPKESEPAWPLRGLWRSEDQTSGGQTLYLEFLHDGRIRMHEGRGGESHIPANVSFTLEGNQVVIVYEGEDGEPGQEFRGTVNGSVIQGAEGPVGYANDPATFERVE